MAKSNITEAVTKIYEQLQGLDAEERLRAAKAALTMLGEFTDDSQFSQKKKGQKEELPGDSFSEKANTWIKKYAIKQEDLNEMFHLDNGKVELILGKAIGDSNRQKTANTYLLTGVVAFLETGIPNFSDDIARGYCRHLGCYDSPNHSNYVKALENKVTGSKGSGWKLTAPGLIAATKLISGVQKDDK